MKKNKVLERLQKDLSEKKSPEQEALLKFSRQTLEQIHYQEDLIKKLKQRLTYLKLEWNNLLHDELEAIAKRLSVNDAAYAATALNYREFCEAFERTRKLKIGDKRGSLYITGTTQPWQWGGGTITPNTTGTLRVDNSTSGNIQWSPTVTPEQKEIMEKSLGKLILEKNVKVKAKRLTTKKLSR